MGRKIISTIFIIVLLVFVLKITSRESWSYRLESMIGWLILIDIIIGVAVILAGFRIGSSGMIAGGAICGLIALSSSPAVNKPSIVTLIIQIIGFIAGVGSVIIEKSRRTLD